MHTVKLHNTYSSPNVIRTLKSRRMRLAGHVARMGEKRNAYRALVGKPKGKTPLGRLSSVDLFHLDVKCTVSTDISDKICRFSRNILFQFLDILQLLYMKKKCRYS
jgi:hypothetical protein